MIVNFAKPVDVIVRVTGIWMPGAAEKVSAAEIASAAGDEDTALKAKITHAESAEL